MARVKALELQVAIKVIELELTQSDDDENKNDEENDISWEEIQKGLWIADIHRSIDELELMVFGR